ncbi:MAG: hypothetical protein AAFR79_03535 [Pseudomonadota bacterium]
MTETTQAGALAESPVSREIDDAITEAVARLDRIDRDPLIRQAVARVSVRRFNTLLAEAFVGYRGDIALELVGVARAIRESREAPEQAPSAAPEPVARPAALRRPSSAPDAPEVADLAKTAAPSEEAAPTGDAAAAADKTGGKTDAADREPAREAGGRGQTDPQGAQPDSRDGQGPRDHGAQRVGQIDPVLRVGGARRI